jgi:single-stranded-DNA-specific exonuclease
VERLVEALKLPAPVCAVLATRGHDDVEVAKRFLRPRIEHLNDPEALADASLAADRIVRAVRQGETVFVHGDYDVDGICATAILTRWLRELGGTVVPFVPHRIRDGYDFSASGLRAAQEAGADLVVTVDCGTVAHETIAAANAIGIDVIVTDHHTVADTLPEAYAVVNPKRPDCGYPAEDLCGSGLAWQLCRLVASRIGADPSALEALLDLVALATVADLVPLVGENRVLVQYGLRQIARAPSSGVRALLRVAEVDAEGVNAGKLGFQLAPRINAAGRIGESADALRLLLTDDDELAQDLAHRLDALNRERRDEDSRTLDEALAELAASFDPERDFGVVLDGEGWHPGVIGIVASRVVERLHRPVVMLARDGAAARGSARSIPGFHLYEALAACSEHLERFGGHRQAAGMDIPTEAIPAFREAFNREARARLTPELLQPVLRPDIEVSLRDTDIQLAHWLAYLGPHGMGNPGPTFLARGLTVTDARVVGTGHLKAKLQQGGASLDAIGFSLADRLPPESLGSGRWDALFRLERNEYRGRVTAQAKLLDLRAEGA